MHWKQRLLFPDGNARWQEQMKGTYLEVRLWEGRNRRGGAGWGRSWRRGAALRRGARERGGGAGGHWHEPCSTLMRKGRWQNVKCFSKASCSLLPLTHATSDFGHDPTSPAFLHIINSPRVNPSCCVRSCCACGVTWHHTSCLGMLARDLAYSSESSPVFQLFILPLPLCLHLLGSDRRKGPRWQW